MTENAASDRRILDKNIDDEEEAIESYQYAKKRLSTAGAKARAAEIQNDEREHKEELEEEKDKLTKSFREVFSAKQEKKFAKMYGRAEHFEKKTYLNMNSKRQEIEPGSNVSPERAQQVLEQGQSSSEVHHPLSFVPPNIMRILRPVFYSRKPTGRLVDITSENLGTANRQREIEDIGIEVDPKDNVRINVPAYIKNRESASRGLFYSYDKDGKMKNRRDNVVGGRREEGPRAPERIPRHTQLYSLTHNAKLAERLKQGELPDPPDGALQIVTGDRKNKDGTPKRYLQVYRRKKKIQFDKDGKPHIVDSEGAWVNPEVPGSSMNYFTSRDTKDFEGIYASGEKAVNAFLNDTNIDLFSGGEDDGFLVALARQLDILGSMNIGKYKNLTSIAKGFIREARDITRGDTNDEHWMNAQQILEDLKGTLMSMGLSPNRLNDLFVDVMVQNMNGGIHYGSILNREKEAVNTARSYELSAMRRYEEETAYQRYVENTPPEELTPDKKNELRELAKKYAKESEQRGFPNRAENEGEDFDDTIDVGVDEDIKEAMLDAQDEYWSKWAMENKVVDAKIVPARTGSGDYLEMTVPGQDNMPRFEVIYITADNPNWEDPKAIKRIAQDEYMDVIKRECNTGFHKVVEEEKAYEKEHWDENHSLRDEDSDWKATYDQYIFDKAQEKVDERDRELRNNGRTTLNEANRKRLRDHYMDAFAEEFNELSIQEQNQTLREYRRESAEDSMPQHDEYAVPIYDEEGHIIGYNRDYLKEAGFDTDMISSVANGTYEDDQKRSMAERAYYKELERENYSNSDIAALIAEINEARADTGVNELTPEEKDVIRTAMIGGHVTSALKNDVDKNAFKVFTEKKLAKQKKKKEFWANKEKELPPELQGAAIVRTKAGKEMGQAYDDMAQAKADLNEIEARNQTVHKWIENLFQTNRLKGHISPEAEKKMKEDYNSYILMRQFITSATYNQTSFAGEHTDESWHAIENRIIGMLCPKPKSKDKLPLVRNERTGKEFPAPIKSSTDAERFFKEGVLDEEEYKEWVMYLYQRERMTKLVKLGRKYGWGHLPGLTGDKLEQVRAIRNLALNEIEIAHINQMNKMYKNAGQPIAAGAEKIMIMLSDSRAQLKEDLAYAKQDYEATVQSYAGAQDKYHQADMDYNIKATAVKAEAFDKRCARQKLVLGGQPLSSEAVLARMKADNEPLTPERFRKYANDIIAESKEEMNPSELRNVDLDKLYEKKERYAKDSEGMYINAPKGFVGLSPPVNMNDTSGVFMHLAKHGTWGDIASIRKYMAKKEAWMDEVNRYEHEGDSFEHPIPEKSNMMSRYKVRDKEYDDFMDAYGEEHHELEPYEYYLYVMNDPGMKLKTLMARRKAFMDAGLRDPIALSRFILDHAPVKTIMDRAEEYSKAYGYAGGDVGSRTILAAAHRGDREYIKGVYGGDVLNTIHFTPHEDMYDREMTEEELSEVRDEYENKVLERLMKHKETRRGQSDEDLRRIAKILADKWYKKILRAEKGSEDYDKYRIRHELKGKKLGRRYTGNDQTLIDPFEEDLRTDEEKAEEAEAIRAGKYPDKGQVEPDPEDRIFIRGITPPTDPKKKKGKPGEPIKPLRDRAYQIELDKRYADKYEELKGLFKEYNATKKDGKPFSEGDLWYYTYQKPLNMTFEDILQDRHRVNRVRSSNSVPKVESTSEPAPWVHTEHISEFPELDEIDWDTFNIDDISDKLDTDGASAVETEVPIDTETTPETEAPETEASETEVPETEPKVTPVGDGQSSLDDFVNKSAEPKFPTFRSMFMKSRDKVINKARGGSRW